jgi:hypothetical protein
MKLLDEPRLAQAWLADDQDELAFACPSALPSPCQQSQFLLARDERRERPPAAAPSSAAGANDAEELDRLRQALNPTESANA